jgi:hypothetical protein
LHDAKEVRTRWKEYREELYKGGDNKDDDKEAQENVDDMRRDVLKDEPMTAIREMKNNKAEGIDNKPIAMLKSHGEKGTKEPEQLCKDIYKTGVWPEDF